MTLKPKWLASVNLKFINDFAMRSLAERRGTRLASEHNMCRSIAKLSGLCILFLLVWAGAAHAASLTLAWDASPGATGYTIYYGTQSGVYTSYLNVGNQTSRQVTGLIDGIPYYFVVKAYNAFNMESGPSTEVSRRVGVPISTAGDFDGSHAADLTVYRPSDGNWYTRFSGSGAVSASHWGESTDLPEPADYDGDGKIDIAVFRPANGTWYVVPSSTGAPYALAWGNGADKPVPGDYDGDGKADLAVFRPSNGTWYVSRSSNPASPLGYPWGNGADKPVPGDYDGDGKTDVAVFRPSNGTWYIVKSNTGAVVGIPWGNLARQAGSRRLRRRRQDRHRRVSPLQWRVVRYPVEQRGPGWICMGQLR